MAKTYRAIPGIGTGRFSLQVAMRNRMYQGPDHLLIVQSTGYTEEYRRIFYRDIRYVDVRPSQRQIWLGVVQLSCIIVLGLLLYVLPLALGLFFMAPFVIALIFNLVSGPSCDCYVTTGVQTLKIPTPRRRNKVALFIAFLREKAEAPPAAELSGSTAA
jgi:hypothetical protein